MIPAGKTISCAGGLKYALTVLAYISHSRWFLALPSFIHLRCWSIVLSYFQLIRDKKISFCIPLGEDSAEVSFGGRVQPTIIIPDIHGWFCIWIHRVSNFHLNCTGLLSGLVTIMKIIARPLTFSAAAVEELESIQLSFGRDVLNASITSS